MKIWVEGSGMSGPTDMNLFMTAVNVVEYWKSFGSCVKELDSSLEQQLEQAEKTCSMYCWIDFGSGLATQRSAVLTEVDEFYENGEWKGDKK